MLICCKMCIDAAKFGCFKRKWWSLWKSLAFNKTFERWTAPWKRLMLNGAWFLSLIVETCEVFSISLYMWRFSVRYYWARVQWRVVCCKNGTMSAMTSAFCNVVSDIHRLMGLSVLRSTALHECQASKTFIYWHSCNAVRRNTGSLSLNKCGTE